MHRDQELWTPVEAPERMDDVWESLIVGCRGKSVRFASSRSLWEMVLRLVGGAAGA